MSLPLRRLMPLLAVLLTVSSIAVAGRATWAEWVRLQAADQASQALQDFRLALVAAEMASRERGPANAVMGQGASASAMLRQHLVLARGRTDAAFAALQAMLQVRVADPRYATAQSHFDHARRQLQVGRAHVDGVARLPPSQADAEVIRVAVAAMAAVIPELMPAAEAAADGLQRAAPAIGGEAQAVKMAADLREQAGLLGSHLTAALALQRPLTRDEQLTLARTRGRIDQLREQLALRQEGQVTPPVLRSAWTQVQVSYFQTGLTMVEAVIRQGEQRGDYGQRPAGFAERYVPQMDAIVVLRDRLLGDISASVVREAQAARQALALTAGVTAASLLLLVLMLGTLQRRLLQPLGATIRVLHGMARGDYTRTLPEVRHRDEMAEVVQAVKTLRQHALLQQAREQERSALIARLNLRSNTDFLTGLPNRRCFVHTAQRLLEGTSLAGRPAALVLLDIDHFKSVNDRFGHETGDQALVHVARGIHAVIRPADLAARLGGEEFVVLLEGADGEQARQFAERLREHLCAQRLPLADGVELAVTASLGVALHQGGVDDLDGLLKRADAAMYRAKAAGRNCVVLA